MQIILASQSPRRRELLGIFRLPFSVAVADIDETMDPKKPPEEEVARVSRAKAMAIPAPDDAIVIAADTIVTVGGTILGKPKDEEDAARMLRLLSGRGHRVMTGLTVRQGETCVTQTVMTTVHFRPLTGREISAYIATGEPMDKAGAYGAQGLANVFLDGMEGDFYNVMGLPVSRLAAVLRDAFGLDVLEVNAHG